MLNMIISVHQRFSFDVHEKKSLGDWTLYDNNLFEIYLKRNEKS